jgi:hypothetical protein
MQFLSLFQKESVKMEVYKAITYGFLRFNNLKKIYKTAYLILY